MSTIYLMAEKPCECHLRPCDRKWSAADSGPKCGPCCARDCIEEADRFLLSYSDNEPDLDGFGHGDCGMMHDGTCTKAGAEECDWNCPFPKL